MKCGGFSAKAIKRREEEEEIIVPLNEEKKKKKKLLLTEYFKKNAALLELYNDYNGTIGKFGSYCYDGKVFIKKIPESQNNETWDEGHQNIVLKMASKLKENATLFAQLEYYTRNIPIEDTSAQLNLIIQYIQCRPKTTDIAYSFIMYPDDPLLEFARHIFDVCRGARIENRSKATAAICHLLVTLFIEAGAKDVVLNFVQTTAVSHRLDNWSTTLRAYKGLNSGTVAVVSDDADVDSAIDKFIAVSIQAPWRLRRILVQESVYQQFKDALSWKCNLNKSVRKSLTSDVLCSDTLTYNDKTFLIDPVELTQEKQSRHVVTVEAYRTTKEMISLVQQYQARYLSLWTNGIAEINEVTHSTISPVVWVNNVADFRGPPKVSEAVVSDGCFSLMKKCEKVARLCQLSQSWLKLDLESRRDILYRFLDQCIGLLDPKKLYTDIRNSLSACTLNSFVDVGKDYVCMGMSQPRGIVGSFYKKDFFFSPECFELILKGNALILFTHKDSSSSVDVDLELLEQSGVPVAYLDFVDGDFPVWASNNPTRTRVVWTNSGTIFAN